MRRSGRPSSRSSTSCSEKGDEKRAWRVASTVTTLAFLGLASITAITMLFAEPLLGVFYDGPVPHLTVQLTWILMPTVVLLGFAGIVQAILNSFGEFFVPAIAPVLWNLVIAGGLVFAMTIDDADQALLVYAWATLLGTVVQVVFPLPWLRGRPDGCGSRSTGATPPCGACSC